MVRQILQCTEQIQHRILFTPQFKSFKSIVKIVVQKFPLQPVFFRCACSTGLLWFMYNSAQILILKPQISIYNHLQPTKGTKVS